MNSTLIAEVLGQRPRKKSFTGRLVLNLTGDIQSMVTGHKTKDHIEKERILIVKTIQRLERATCDALAVETGIAHEHVSSRLAWLRRKGIVEPWRGQNKVVWSLTNPE